MKVSGVYKIQSKKCPVRCYVGSAKNIHARWLIHLRDLRRDKHHSIKLQNHYNKYGKDDLVFSILIGCDPGDLVCTEQFFMDSLKPYFNVCKKAYSCFGRVLSEETKEKIRQKKLGVPLSEYHRQRCSEGQKSGKHPLRTDEWNKKISDAQKGRKLTEEHKEKLSKAKKGKRAWNKGLKTGKGQKEFRTKVDSVCPN